MDMTTPGSTSGAAADDAALSATYEKKFGNNLWQENTLYVLLGTDDGAFPQYILTRGIPSGSRYLFIEADHLMPRSAPQESSKVVITPLTQWRQSLLGAGLSQYAYIGNVSLARSRNAQEASDQYAALIKEVEAELKQLLWEHKSQFDARIHYKTQLSNVAENQTPASVLSDIFRGRTAFVIGAGPSLDTLMPLLQKHRDDAVVISVSRTSSTLINAGVRPDIIVTADPQALSFTVAHDTLRFGQQTLLVNANSASPLIVGQWQGPSVYLNAALPWQDRNQDNNLGVHPPTVTNTALHLALEMGVSEIVLFGVDLCFSQEGHSYATGNIERDKGAMAAHIDHTIKTNDGHSAETNSGYYSAIQSFSDQAKRAKAAGCRVINPSPSSAYIKHVDYVPEQNIDIIAPLVGKAWEIIQHQLPPQSGANRERGYLHMLTQLDHATLKLKKIKRLAAKALRVNQRLANDDGRTICPKQKSTMDKIERVIQRRYAELDATIKLFNGEKFGKSLSVKEAEELTLDDVIQQGDRYYRSYIDGLDELLGYIQRSIQRVKNRLEEEAENPDIDLLLAQWSADSQPARSTLWRLRHPDAFNALSEEDKNKLQQLETAAQAQASHQKSIYGNYANEEALRSSILGSVLDRAIEHFERQDSESLQRLNTGLSNRDEQSSAQLSTLVTGFIAELAHQQAQALAHYQSLGADTPWTLRQIALERALQILMAREDYHAALETLDTLQQKIPSYTPFYANLLEITGEIKKAADVYSGYLSSATDDTNTMETFGLFLARHGATEGAEVILEQLANIDPDHAGNQSIREAINKTSALSQVG